jgi:hypothetical protein
VLMHYEQDGTFASADLASSVDLGWCRKMLARAWEHSVPFGEYVASRRRRTAAA